MQFGRTLPLPQCECVQWIHLAEDRVQCRAVVDTVMNLGVHFYHHAGCDDLHWPRSELGEQLTVAKCPRYSN
jgi:hypothetical protein